MSRASWLAVVSNAKSTRPSSDSGVARDATAVALSIDIDPAAIDPARTGRDSNACARATSRRAL